MITMQSTAERLTTCIGYMYDNNAICCQTVQQFAKATYMTSIPFTAERFHNSAYATCITTVQLVYIDITKLKHML
jgi:hypothetical protein